MHLNVLGGFSAVKGSAEITGLSSKKAQALLSMLACDRGKPIKREKLALLFWPDNASEFAKTNLRQCLAVIRKATLDGEHSALKVTRDTVALDTQTVTSDIDRYKVYIADGSVDALEHAVKLYRGPLIDGINVDSRPFSDWLTIERQRLYNAQQTALYSLLENYGSTGDVSNQARIADKLLELDPLNEIAHETKMRCFVNEGRRSDALAQFRQCQSLLKDELAIEPGANIKSYYDSIASANWNNGEGTTTTNEINSASAQNQSLPAVNRLSKRMITTIAVAALAVVFIWLAKKALFPTEFENEKDSTTNTQSGNTLTDLSRINRHSIAVLPFANLSDDDDDQRYFTDGLSEDLITDLSRASNLFVIARGSSFSYREESPDIAKIAQELNVRYVLVGSVRRAGERLRINAQLVDATTGSNIWADRYDRAAADVLEIQDEISRAIVGQLAIKLSDSDQKRFEKIRQVNTDAYDMLLRGLAPIRRIDKQSSAEAREIFKRAIELDPSYARAYANLGLSYAQDTNFGFSDNKSESLRLAVEALNMAESLDSSLPQLYFAKTVLALGQRDAEAAKAAAYKAVELDPSYADGYGNLAQVLLYSGDYTNARKALRNAKLLNPKYTFTYLWVEGQIYLFEGEFEKAATVFEEINQRNPAFVSGRTLLISTLGHLGRIDDAEWEIEELFALEPDFSLSVAGPSSIIRLPKQLEYYITGLRKAGIPE